MALLTTARTCAALAYRAAMARAGSRRGQTAAEYMGVLLLVALIISALVTLDVHGFIAKEVKSLVDSIATGDDPKKDGG